MSAAGLRAALRLAAVGVHLSGGVAVAACVYPFVAPGLRLRLTQRWSRRLLALLGVRLRAVGAAAPPGGLLVANHVSWLDVFVINAVAPAAFVCKAEVRRWPLIGWLCERGDTVFLERGSRAAAARARQRIAARLATNHRVAVFPEGTTSAGPGVLPFHGALFQAAIDAGCGVQPLALRYLDGAGRHSTLAAYCGQTRLWQSLRAVAAAPALTVELEILPPLRPRGARRELAQAARRMICGALERAPARRPAQEAGEALPAQSPAC